jgi:hypothetical protein
LEPVDHKINTHDCAWGRRAWNIQLLQMHKPNDGSLCAHATPMLTLIRAAWCHRKGVCNIISAFAVIKEYTHM